MFLSLSRTLSFFSQMMKAEYEFQVHWLKGRDQPTEGVIARSEELEKERTGGAHSTTEKRGV